MLIALGVQRPGRKNATVTFFRTFRPTSQPRLVFLFLTLCCTFSGPARGETFVAVEEGSPTMYIEALEDLPDDGNPTGWTALGYDLTQDIGKGDPSNGSDGWQAGIHGVGMEDGDDNTLVVFDASVFSVYTRTEFTIPSAADFQGMTLAIDFDDGYIAWLNGVEIHRSFSMEGVAPVWNSVTTFTHEASNTRTLGPPIELNAFTSLLVDGVNVLAIGTWNFGPLNSDMTMIPRLTLFDEPFSPPDPFHCYLTWQNDTSTTMTVNCHTHSDTGESTVHYDRRSRGGDIEKYKFMATGSSHHIPGLDAIQGADRTIHIVELTGLTPGRDYYFVAGDPVTGYTAEKKFRTLPAGEESIRFVTGGDMSTELIVRDLMTQAAAQDPMFALLGGDIAYANGLLTGWALWETWLNRWEELMVTPGGHSILIILSIGNHETEGGIDQFDNPPSKAPFHFGYFAQHGAGVGPERRAYFHGLSGENRSSRLG